MAKVLLVEDDNNLREIYEARLSAEGYEITTAQNGEEALSVAKQTHPDLIISDVMMPRVSGFEMLDILRNTEELKDTKIIMLTALGQTEDRGRADNLGADKYLVKSQVTLEDIVNAAKNILGDDQPTAEAEEPIEVAAVVTPEPASTTTETAAEPTPVAVEPTPVYAPTAVTPVTLAAEMPAAPAAAETAAETHTPVTLIDSTQPNDTASIIPTTPSPADPVIQPEPTAAPVVTTSVTVVDPDPLRPATTNSTPIDDSVAAIAEPIDGEGSTTAAPVTPTAVKSPVATEEQIVPSAPELDFTAPSNAPEAAIAIEPTDPEPIMPESSAPIEASTSIEPVATPEPAPTAPAIALDPSLDPVTAQTLADEEAAIQSQIDAFEAAPIADTPAPAQNDISPTMEVPTPAPTSEPTALIPPAQAVNDAVLDSAIQKLTGNSSDMPAPTMTTPEPVLETPVIPVAPKSPSTSTQADVVGHKVIQPLGHEEAPTPSLEALLAAEDAKETVTTEPMPIAAQADAPASERPAIDPNSIAL